MPRAVLIPRKKEKKEELPGGTGVKDLATSLLWRGSLRDPSSAQEPQGAPRTARKGGGRGGRYLIQKKERGAEKRKQPRAGVRAAGRPSEARDTALLPVPLADGGPGSSLSATVRGQDPPRERESQAQPWGPGREGQGGPRRVRGPGPAAPLVPATSASPPTAALGSKNMKGRGTRVGPRCPKTPPGASSSHQPPGTWAPQPPEGTPASTQVIHSQIDTQYCAPHLPCRHSTSQTGAPVLRQDTPRKAPNTHTGAPTPGGQAPQTAPAVHPCSFGRACGVRLTERARSTAGSAPSTRPP